jgi:hypothetical protein
MGHSDLISKIVLPYHKAHHLIKEGDVLLFRSRAWYSWFVKSYTGSPYTHVGVASRHNGGIEVVEFHSNTGGGVSRNLAQIVKAFPNEIDVYRPAPIWSQCHIAISGNLAGYDIVHKVFEFTPKVARKITNTMRKMTGLPYGWKRIIWMGKRKLAGLRLVYKHEDLMDDTLKDVVYPVCSTSLAYAFSKHGFDLIHNKADEWTEPGHIALSSNLAELFTIGWDEQNDSAFL